MLASFVVRSETHLFSTPLNIWHEVDVTEGLLSLIVDLQREIEASGTPINDETRGLT
jgi:hypothetical protein